MPRQNASPALKAIVRERFSHECAACDLGNQLNIDVAHLFEDATVSPASEERLILLCPSCNQRQERAKRPRESGLVHRLLPLKVSVLALERYLHGNYRGAYQSSRLAAYLFERHEQYPKAAACLIEALSAARPLRWGDLLCATLLQFERLCTSRTVGMLQRWLFLDRFALVLYDSCKWKWSTLVHEESLRLRARLGADQRDPDQLVFDRMSSFRREALIQGSTAAHSRKALAAIVKRLEDDATEFLRLGHHDSYATNLDVAAKLELEVLGDPAQALRLGELALERKNEITHWWVLQEHYWRLAELYAQKGDRTREVESVVSALRVFCQVPVLLEPVLTAAGPVRHNPIADLALHRVPEAFLRERNVAPSGTGPEEVPLQLTGTTIKRIVAAVLTDGA